METIAIDQLPLFDLQGNPTSLSAHFREYLLVIFLRHLAWLPCQSHLVEVNAFKSEFRRRNIDVVVVSFAEPEKLIPYVNFHEWPFPLLADPERKLYQAFDLKSLSWLKVFSPATLKLYLKLFRKGLRLQDYGKEDVYQAGGDFLLDRAGNVLLAHRSEDPADRPSVARLLKAFDGYLRPPAQPTSRRLSY